MTEKVARGNKLSVLGSKEGLRQARARRGLGSGLCLLPAGGLQAQPHVWFSYRKGIITPAWPLQGEGLAERLAPCPLLPSGLAMVSV